MVTPFKFGKRAYTRGMTKSAALDKAFMEAYVDFTPDANHMQDYIGWDCGWESGRQEDVNVVV